MRDAVVEVVEYTDPTCSWAWGTEPKLRLLRWRHGHWLRWRTVMGGLVGDARRRRPDWDPILAARPMEEYWHTVSAFTGQPYPKPMHRMLWSTDPAGLGVHAARLQGDEVADRVLRRFRETIFVFGIGPDDADSMAAAIDGVPDLDLDRWRVDVASPEVAAAYRADWEETRQPNDFVRHLEGDRPGIGSMKQTDGHDRYAFPTLIIRGPGGETTLPGWLPFADYVAALEVARPGSTADPARDPTPAEAFARWPVLTGKELEVLCGAAAEPPAGIVTHDWGDGVVHLTRAEAEARDLA